MSKKIVIIDDAPFMRMMIRNALRPAGFEICAEAGDGEQAVALYREHRPDAMTLDITMPGMSGLEALRLIRTEFPEAKIVMVTAIDQKEALAEAVSLGAADFIVKPFESERVLTAVRRAAGIRNS